MSADPVTLVLDDLERILSRERAAIIDLDAVEVEALSSHKESLVNQLAALPIPAGARDRVKAVVATLRRNCVLLVHARDLTKSLLGPNAKESRRGVRVSLSR